MGYTALDMMRRINKEKYGIDGPEVPTDKNLVRGAGNETLEITDLEKHVISFIRNRCEGLRFDNKDPKRVALEDADGKSIKEAMIPYNMEKDLDRLTFETCLHRFMESGAHIDAFNVYFCFLEMFTGSYGKNRKMIEALAEFEANASSLLMKHRDHYSHSVYNFLIGMAVYDTNSDYRNTYESWYGKEAKSLGISLEEHFLKHWGFASLFHDIGYPFELPFEEVKSYFGNTIKNVPFLAYKQNDKYVELPKDEVLLEKYKKFGTKHMGTQNEILAEGIVKTIGERYRKLCMGEDLKAYEKSAEEYYDYILNDVLNIKPSSPDAFGGFMDHAYFSAHQLMRSLIEILNEDEITPALLDAITAILLHNSIFKFSVENKNREDFSKDDALKEEEHPIAFLLMLADELQCWDRKSYGQNSRKELHAYDCGLYFDEDGVTAKYLFDAQQEHKALSLGDEVGGTYAKMIKKNKDDGVMKFQSDIEEILYLNRNGAMKLTVKFGFEKNRRFLKQYLSDTNFMHIYNFAVLLCGRKTESLSDALDEKTICRMDEKFNSQSLEYKVINVERVKKFAYFLDKIDCFYTDRPVAYEPVHAFSNEELRKIAPYEHARWLLAHMIMGWKYDTRYNELDLSDEEKKRVRELTRTHMLVLQEDYDQKVAFSHFEALSEEEKIKDEDWINPLLNRLEAMDGIRVYRL